MSLHAVPQHTELVLVPVEPGSGATLTDMAAGLQRMVQRAAAGYGWGADDIAPILAALAVETAPADRRDAVIALGRLHADWTNSVKGQVEVASVWTWIVPRVHGLDVLAEIAGELSYADDRRWHRTNRDAALNNAELLAARVAGLPVRGVIPIYLRNRDDDGPGAA